jgi:hypothetical protein
MVFWRWRPAAHKRRDKQPSAVSLSAISQKSRYCDMSQAKTLALFFVTFLCFVYPALSADQISYTSQPDQVAVFLNDIAFVRDVITLPGGADVQVILPSTAFVDTLILRENGGRVGDYRINRSTGIPILEWQSGGDVNVREVSLEYLLSGISWTPKYDMWLADDAGTGEASDDGSIAESVQFDFFAEITNTALTLDAIDVRLIAGRVDTTQQIDGIANASMNQVIVGYAAPEQQSGGASSVGAANIQYVYNVGDVSAEPGDTVYVSLAENALAARRLLVWNSRVDNQVTIIYKVLNESALPFAEGSVRTYQNDLFVGSDFVELTPIGGEGSITVGHLQDVRVSRSETQLSRDAVFTQDTQYTVELTLTNFASRPYSLDVVDYYPVDANSFEFVLEPQRELGNVLRWSVEIQPGETLNIRYSYLA